MVELTAYQWGTDVGVRISKVSLFQGLIYMQELFLGNEKKGGALISEVSLEGVPLYKLLVESSCAV